MNKQTRRSFLSTCSAAAVAAAVPPSFYLQTSDKSGARLPVVGSGFHAYECLHDWLVPPAGLVWGDTHGLCQDEQGYIYVGHTVHKSSMRGEAIVVFDEKGRFIRAFGEGFRGGAHGLKLRREGKDEFLYHCDINRCRVVKTTLTGEEIWVHGYPREDANYADRPIDFVPTNVAFAPGIRIVPRSQNPTDGLILRTARAPERCTDATLAELAPLGNLIVDAELARTKVTDKGSSLSRISPISDFWIYPTPP